MKKTTFILIAAAAAALASCSENERPQRSLATGEMADQEFADFTTMESDSGRVKWILEAPVARIYTSRKLLVTDTPRIRFYDENGEVSSVLTADKGEYNQVSHDLTALGNVVITTSEGYTLETESLVYLRELGEIHSEDFVTVTRGDDILTGYGFTGYPELKNVDIKRDVRAFLRDDDGLVDEEVRGERERDGGPR
ncbi:MAG: LPS export ABC transporter periplasmic protein LptC [Candidatus Krumholzibacteria bacterium]|nr:LPS export ABC transporter periplasmic protein LptC [Candidatus Krumholzibacteria bacterium]